MIIKIHTVNNRKILVICDSNLLNKKFFQGKLQLDLTKDFYQGQEKTEEEIKEIIKEADIVHLVGEESLKLIEELGLINKEDKVIRIKNIPHIEVLILRE